MLGEMGERALKNNPTIPHMLHRSSAGTAQFAGFGPAPSNASVTHPLKGEQIIAKVFVAVRGSHQVAPLQRRGTRAGSSHGLSSPSRSDEKMPITQHEPCQLDHSSLDHSPIPGTKAVNH
jgi:hypothetical protein